MISNSGVTSFADKDCWCGVTDDTAVEEWLDKEKNENLRNIKRKRQMMRKICIYTSYQPTYLYN